MNDFLWNALALATEQVALSNLPSSTELTHHFQSPFPSQIYLIFYKTLWWQRIDSSIRYRQHFCLDLHEIHFRLSNVQFGWPTRIGLCGWSMKRVRVATGAFVSTLTIDLTEIDVKWALMRPLLEMVAALLLVHFSFPLEPSFPKAPE